MSIPKSLKIGPYTYSITEDKAKMAKKQVELKASGQFGLLDPREQCIYIDQDIHPQSKRTTLLHEALHAVCGISALRQAEDEEGRVTEEQFIESVDSGIVLLLRDNPELVAYLTSDD